MGLFRSKNIDILVTSRLGTLKLQLPKTATGKHVLNRMATVLGLREFWYFGLSCANKMGEYNWLDLNKKLLDQDLCQRQPVVLRFTIKYFPENVDKIMLNITKRLFYLHMRDMVHSDVIFVPLEVAVVLASYAAQEQYGDYDPSMHSAGLMIASGLLPQSLLQQYNLTELELEMMVYQHYGRRLGLSRAAAISIYLKICQDLHMFGVRHSPVTNTRGAALFISVDSFGLKIFSTDNLLLPKTAFNLGEIRKVEFKRNNLTFSVGCDEESQFVLFTTDIAQARRLFLRCLGYRDLYIRGISEEPSLLSYIVEGAGKDIFNDTSFSGRSPEEVAMEAQKLEDILNNRLRQYDTDLWNAKQEFYLSMRESEGIEKEMAKRNIRQQQAVLKHQKTVRAKGFYDFHTTVSAVTIPSLAREHRQLEKESKRLSQAASESVQEAEHFRHLHAEAKRKTATLKNRLETEFIALDLLLPFDDGISENDESVSRSAEFPRIAREDWKQPWSGLRSYIRHDPTTLHEIAHLEQKLGEHLVENKQMMMDHLYRSLLQGIWDKYDAARQTMMTDIKDRVHTIDKF